VSVSVEVINKGIAVKKGIVFVADPNGVATIYRISHIISRKRDGIEVSARIIPKGIAQKE